MLCLAFRPPVMLSGLEPFFCSQALSRIIPLGLCLVPPRTLTTLPPPLADAGHRAFHADPPQPQSGVDLVPAPKLQASPTAPKHSPDATSPRIFSSHDSIQNLAEPSIDALHIITLPSRPDSQSRQHIRTTSDCSIDSSAFGSSGDTDANGLPLTDLISIPSPTMAQPTISRHISQDGWTQRLEQRAEHYNMSVGHGAPLTPQTSQARHSPAMKRNGQGHAQYTTNSGNYNFNAVGTSSDGQYQRSQHTPVTPNFSDFQMESVITSPQVEQSQSWEENPISPFDFQYDSTSSHHSQNRHPQSFDESKVQPWWPPTTGGAPPQQSRYHRQTSAPAIPQDQPQYGSYYPVHGNSTQTMSSSGLMINCQPGANEIGHGVSLPPANAMYASSAPSTHPSVAPYQRHPSMPQMQQSRRSSSHPSTYASGASSASSSRRASKSQTQPHNRAKSSASPPRQNGKDSPHSGNVGFVNFTPSDKKKILTGVAPSGSSKTKLRREKEAQERRRRLNEAAQRAVMEAGGDVTALERSGLFTQA